MKAVVQLLLSSILHANYVLGRSQVSRCVEFNFRAASLQGGESCAFINAIIRDGDILTGSIEDIGTACGARSENIDGPSCVEEVVDVVARMTEEGCDVTGG